LFTKEQIFTVFCVMSEIETGFKDDIFFDTCENDEKMTEKDRVTYREVFRKINAVTKFLIDSLRKMIKEKDNLCFNDISKHNSNTHTHTGDK